MTIDELIEMMTDEDFDLAVRYLKPIRKKIEKPDLVIAPDGEPYLFRWHLFPYKSPAGAYFHIQVKSDPERPLHDHPWHNTSTILSGGYDEMYHPAPEMLMTPGNEPLYRRLRKDKYNYVVRDAREAHRLILPPNVPYTMTVFTTGPYAKEWGFWYPDGFHSHKEHVAMRDGVSVHVHKGE